MARYNDCLSDLAELLTVLDDEEIVALHPGLLKGYRVRITGIVTNFQLYPLMEDALIGPPQEGWLPGRRPDPRVVAAAHNELIDGDAPVAEAALNLVAWYGLQTEKIRRRLDERRRLATFVWLEQRPADIPLFEGERVVLLEPSPFGSRRWPIGPWAEGMVSDVRVTEILSRDAVEHRLRRIEEELNSRDPWLRARGWLRRTLHRD